MGRCCLRRPKLSNPCLNCERLDFPVTIVDYNFRVFGIGMLLTGRSTMTIVPEGGWEDLSPREEKGAPQPVTGYSPAPSYLRCKVCDCGTLTAKKVFRLSGPAVAIGYILLIPSVLGIAFCALMLIAVNVGTITLESGRPLQSTFDARFRRNCASGFRSSYFQA